MEAIEAKIDELGMGAKASVWRLEGLPETTSAGQVFGFPRLQCLYLCTSYAKQHGVRVYT